MNLLKSDEYEIVRVVLKSGEVVRYSPARVLQFYDRHTSEHKSVLSDNTSVVVHGVKSDLEPIHIMSTFPGHTVERVEVFEGTKITAVYERRVVYDAATSIILTNEQYASSIVRISL